MLEDWKVTRKSGVYIVNEKKTSKDKVSTYITLPNGMVREYKNTYRDRNYWLQLIDEYDKINELL